MKRLKKEILLKFGKRIQLLRKGKGFSQESLAYEIGVHRTYMGFIERGERNLTLLNIEKLSHALDITLSDLFNF
ncbi:MAG: helix-turn-helix transcriptional regulator [Candidatus Margulisbacteria bacterium]|nr:helix-turn-helix transcriptional regulator [Candidatus Margulisiibacteriota bacterium]